ncbi:DUF3945 domain-containing protein [Hymenobacter sp. HDW8]|uniref:DUF3945 domain-containing protein n=1 Tax=Hymenobacter sp. HDW8 TaxID=2714932 RepID=UPI00140CC39D|nr:DUF3945 domain-containing protein [Hymenobacter sp. HDW8]QIL78323.1 DUF3945 domain-containing protein [Hymenobacter sp. HDW8]
MAQVIGVLGAPPRLQPAPGDALQGQPVGQVLRHIWDVIDQDPALRQLPQAQRLRRAGQALEGAGLLQITVRDGVVVSFVSNFVDNFSAAQQGLPPRPTGAAFRTTTVAPPRAPLPTPTLPQPMAAPAPLAQPAPAASIPASLLSPAVLEKARALHQQRLTPPAGAFRRADIPGELLAKMGVPLAELEKTGQLDKLLRGEKTDLISSFSLRDGHGETIPFAAKLVLRRDEAGAPSLQFDLPQQQLVIPEQILGKEITPAMKEQLTRHGVVPLADGFRDGPGPPFAAYMAIDQEMNRVVAVRREGIALPKEILGVPLNPQQNKELLEGRPTQMEALTNRKGQLFDATVVLDPVKRTLTFRDVQPHVAQRQQATVEQSPASRPRMRL